MTRSHLRLALLAPMLGTLSAPFGLAQCGNSSSGGGAADAGDATTMDVSSTDTGSEAETAARGDSALADGGGDSDAAPPADGGPGLDGGDASDAADAGDVVEAATPCDASSGCTGSMLCCSSLCVDVAHDPRNCGMCGNACDAGQFCTGTQCDNVAFPNVCANGSVTVVTDPYPPDDEAGISLGMAVATNCPEAGITLSIVPQTQPGVLIPADGGWRPNTGGGTTLVVGGGEYGQLSVQYMDNYGLTPVYLTNDGNTSHIYQRSTGLAVVTQPDTMLTAQHDFFILELAVEPQSGTLCLFGQGIYGPGTVAAGYYGSQVLLPMNASAMAPWYVYEWTDTNKDMTPDNGDTFAPIANGP